MLTTNIHSTTDFTVVPNETIRVLRYLQGGGVAAAAAPAAAAAAVIAAANVQQDGCPLRELKYVQ